LKEFITNKVDILNTEGPKVIIGKNCTIRAASIIYNEVTIGDNCQTGHNVMVREKTSIGNNSLIGTNSVIDGNVTIGNHVSIQTGVYIPLHCKIGDHVFMGPFSKLTNDKYMMRKRYELQGVTLEDYVSLGANSVILPGITLRRGTIVGAGSVVTKDTNEKDIVIGNPACFLKKVPEDWEFTE
jgi:acetyltransferase-like isoleucine patch superfamily enzyme